MELAPAELITVEQFARVWLGVCLAWTLGALGVAAYSAVRCRIPRAAGASALAALLGPLGWAMWVFYEARVAYRPETGVAGLHLVNVLLVNLLIFVLVGVACGYVAYRVSARRGVPDDA